MKKKSLPQEVTALKKLIPPSQWGVFDFLAPLIVKVIEEGKKK